MLSAGLQTFVFVGGGGVGKTTTSAALAVALARQGRRVLLVTIDPARRLADAIGVPLGNTVQTVATETLSLEQGKLFALMPEPRSAMRHLVDDLFRHQPKALKRLLNNAVYQALADAVPGIHELAAMNLVGRALGELELDALVIDTAPSRNAIDFVDYPRRLADLLGGRVVGWLAAVAKRGKHGEPQPSNRVERLLVKAIGPVIVDAAELFSEMALILPRFVELNSLLAELLLGPRSRYLLVAAPSLAGREDARFLHQRLLHLGKKAHGLILNGVGGERAPWVQTIMDAQQTTPAMAAALDAMDHWRRAKNRAADEAEARFRQLDKGMLAVRLQQQHVLEPTRIVANLAASLRSALPAIAGG